MSDDEREELIRLRKENERLANLLEESLKGNTELRQQMKELQESGSKDNAGGMKTRRLGYFFRKTGNYII